MKILSPEMYFKSFNFTESLVLQIRTDKKRFSIVLDYADLVVQELLAFGKAQPRDLRFLKFSKITNFNFKPDKNALRRYQGFSVYDAERTRNQLAIEDISFTQNPNTFSIEIIIFSWGGYRFKFGSFEEKHRFGRGVEVSENLWEYYDADTNQKFDFCHPFGENVYF